jgi:hypothetical protein
LMKMLHCSIKLRLVVVKWRAGGASCVCSAQSVRGPSQNAWNGKASAP